MDKINIGFMGGCINNQRSLGRDHLYYTVLSKQMSQSPKSPDLHIHISLGQYFSYDQLVQQVEQMIDKKKPDLLFLFIRPFPLMPLQKPIIKYDKANGKTARAFHPALFMRKSEWNKKLTEHQRTEPLQLMSKKSIELRDMNLIAGILLGLHYWASKYLAQQIESVRHLCDKQKIKLIVISPPKNPESIIANIICRRTTKYLKHYCLDNQINFVNINLLGLEHFEEDNIHFNIHGHQKLGRLLYDKIIDCNLF